MRTKSFLPKLAMLGIVGLLTFSGQASSAQLNLSYETTAGGTAGPGTITSPSVPSSLYFGNSVAPTPAFSGIYGFFDDFIFTIPGAQSNAVSTTIDLGSALQVTNLQMRLFNYSGNPTPTLGIPSGVVIDAVVSPISTYGLLTVLPTTILAPGTYVLQTRGTATGTYGGSYAGTLNLAPVPIPATAWLLGSGLLGLIGVARRETA